VGPPIAPPPDSIVEYFADWLEQDGHPFWPFFENIRSWWAIRNLPNLLLLHYADLKADLPGQVRRIAAFLDQDLDEGRLPEIVEHASFGWMKAHAAQAAPLGGAIFEGGAATFINRGTNGRWQGELPDALSRRYEAVAERELGPECARWLATGAR
jgi:aryl sulfotransferase